MAKKGRRALAPDQRRSELLRLFLTREEAAAVKDAARAAGQDWRDWLRKVASEAAADRVSA